MKRVLYLIFLYGLALYTLYFGKNKQDNTNRQITAKQVQPQKH